MGEFYLEKYPVISKNGREYFVSIYTNRWVYKHVYCEIYVKRVGWFGREKFILVSGDAYNRSIYDEVEWDYDYVGISINEVKKYEQALDRQRKHEEARKVGACQFEAWDGRASE